MNENLRKEKNIGSLKIGEKWYMNHVLSLRCGKYDYYYFRMQISILNCIIKNLRYSIYLRVAV